MFYAEIAAAGLVIVGLLVLIGRSSDTAGAVILALVFNELMMCLIVVFGGIWFIEWVLRQLTP